MIYLLLFLEFFKIGLFTFGGGYAMIPLVKETVLSHHWLDEATLLDLIGVCESTPGPIAINMATFIGSINGGILGSIIATLGVVLPSFIIILLIAKFLSKFLENNYVKNALNGIKPTIIALILSTGLLMFIDVFDIQFTQTISMNYHALMIFILFVLINHLYKKQTTRKLSALEIILISMGLGVLIYTIVPTV